MHVLTFMPLHWLLSLHLHTLTIALSRLMFWQQEVMSTILHHA